MELQEALRTTGAVRSFRPDPVPHDVLAAVLDDARFAPSGGNQQAWHVVVVEEKAKRRALRDLYLTGWYEYLAMSAAGLRPWAPGNDRDAEAAALPAALELAERAASPDAPSAFPETLDQSPAVLAVLVDLGQLAAVDRDLGRYTLAGGASVYPFCWSVLLAARAHGLGGVLTTMATRREPEVQALLGAPAHQVLAAVLVLGYPEHQPRRLRRGTVQSFTTIDTVDGPSLAP